MLSFDLGAATPDANTIRLFREKLTEEGALDMVFADFDRQLKERGYLAVGGQIVDAALVAEPNAAKSKVRARVEHVFARQKDQMGLFICTISIKRAEAKITLAKLAYNMHRLVFHERQAVRG